MDFSELIDEVVNAVHDELGDSAAIYDGTTNLPSVPGIFRREWDDRLSEEYGFDLEAASYECRVDALTSLNLSTVGDSLTVTVAGKAYRVASLRYAPHATVLLVLLK